MPAMSPESREQLFATARRILGDEEFDKIVAQAAEDLGVMPEELHSGYLARYQAPPKPLTRDHVAKIEAAVQAARKEILPPETVQLHTDLINWLRTNAKPNEAMEVLISTLADVTAMSCRNGDDPDEGIPYFESIVRRHTEELVTRAAEFRDAYLDTPVTQGRD